MSDIGMPTKLTDLGYVEKDIDKLVEGTIPQHRVTKLSPIEITPEDIRTLLLKSLDNSWI